MDFTSKKIIQMLSDFFFIKSKRKKPFIVHFLTKKRFSSKNRRVNYINNISLRGKTKNDIIELLGTGTNDFDNDVWYYITHKTWWQMKTVFVIGFQDNIVEFKFIKFVFGKVIHSKLN